MAKGFLAIMKSRSHYSNSVVTDHVPTITSSASQLYALLYTTDLVSKFSLKDTFAVQIFHMIERILHLTAIYCSEEVIFKSSEDCRKVYDNFDSLSSLHFFNRFYLMIEVALIQCVRVDKCLSCVLKPSVKHLTKYVKFGGTNYMLYIYFIYIYIYLYSCIISNI